MLSFGLLTENKQVKEENQSVKKEGEGRGNERNNQTDKVREGEMTMYGISTIAFFCGIIQHYAVAKGGIFMGGQKPEKKKKHICAGLLAHVDAGKNYTF